MAQSATAPKRSVFKRGQKAELFEDGQEADEQQELQGKLEELHAVWAMERTGRDLAAAIWRPELGLAEVVLQKGKLLSHMGFTRGAKLYLFIEEAVYLVDRANLLLFLDASPAGGGGGRAARAQQRLLSLQEAHDLMLATGVDMDRYLVFCKLLRAGYIVQRHPARWQLRPGEDPAHVWGSWGKADGGHSGGSAHLPAQGAPPPAQQQQQQQGPGDSAALPTGPAAKRRKVQAKQPSASWWVAEPATSSQHGSVDAAGGTTGATAGSSNPWLHGMPAGFLESLPRVAVLPDAAQRARADFPLMAPLQSIPLAELQPLGGAAGGRHLLHFDVFSANARFSRKAPGRPAFTVSVRPASSLPTPVDMVAADGAAGGVPVRFSTIEKGDICFYGVTHVELRSILPSH